MQKKLVFILKTSQEFIRYTGEDAVKNYPLLNKLFSSVDRIYLPLLQLLEKMEAAGSDSRIGLVISPIFCALFDSEEIKNLYCEYLDNHIELGKQELLRCKDDEKLLENAKASLAKFENLKTAFTEKYNRNLLKAFSEFQKKGFVELIATSGTDMFVPHYADLPEIISAQIETGLNSYRKSFGENPDGFYLTNLGYANGVEKLIKAYGFSYTILDSRAFLLADKIPSTGTFYPVRIDSSLTAYSAASDVEDVLYGENGFASNKVYLNINRDIGFELSSEDLKTIQKSEIRLSTGYNYWNKNSYEEDISVYDYSQASLQVEKDAEEFLKMQSDLLSQAAELLPEKDFVTQVINLDAEKLLEKWAEGIFWLEKVIINAKKYDISVATCSKMVENPYKLEKLEPYYSAATGSGYGENLLSSKNSWMARYSRKACERIIDLVYRFPSDTGLKTRLLNLGSKELLISLSSGLAKMIDEEEFAEFAENRFKESIMNFTVVFDSLGSNVVSTEWLTTLEVKDNFFPWMNYRIFSKKI